MQPSSTSAYHVPVLLSESVGGLNISGSGGVYVDVTFGGGGHSREVLRRLTAVGGGHLYAFDRDEDAEANVPEDANLTFIRSDFRWLNNWMRYFGVEQIDGLIADLGVSAHHFDDASRGFSIRFDAPLDMRMNRSGGRTAAELLAEESEERLADIFYYFGELRQARRLASVIAAARQTKPIVTTGDLLRATDALFPREREKKERAKMFQALRMEVNQETEALERMLTDAVGLLRQGGRISVITYHSIEDRIVKNIFRTSTGGGEADAILYGTCRAAMRQVNNKVITPSEEELKNNPRSRSAKLRIAEKI
ncbi:MAG: 16S rRNA (cytosine(1402)-N(4))-methyltransferase RsmH [Prevotella sp.]|nr:16S rRNA (cytosine(1402)-N(4))-methyltransferase RsmH [Prevotella sp.]